MVFQAGVTPSQVEIRERTARSLEVAPQGRVLGIRGSNLIIEATRHGRIVTFDLSPSDVTFVDASPKTIQEVSGILAQRQEQRIERTLAGQRPFQQQVQQKQAEQKPSLTFEQYKQLLIEKGQLVETPESRPEARQFVRLGDLPREGARSVRLPAGFQVVTPERERLVQEQLRQLQTRREEVPTAAPSQIVTEIIPTAGRIETSITPSLISANLTGVDPKAVQAAQKAQLAGFGVAFAQPLPSEREAELPRLPSTLDVLGRQDVRGLEQFSTIQRESSRFFGEQFGLLRTSESQLQQRLSEARQSQEEFRRDISQQVSQIQKAPSGTIFTLNIEGKEKIVSKEQALTELQKLRQNRESEFNKFTSDITKQLGETQKSREELSELQRKEFIVGKTERGELLTAPVEQVAERAKFEIREEGIRDVARTPEFAAAAVFLRPIETLSRIIGFGHEKAFKEVPEEFAREQFEIVETGGLGGAERNPLVQVFTRTEFGGLAIGAGLGGAAGLSTRFAGILAAKPVQVGLGVVGATVVGTQLARPDLTIEQKVGFAGRTIGIAALGLAGFTIGREAGTAVRTFIAAPKMAAFTMEVGQIQTRMIAEKEVVTGQAKMAAELQRGTLLQRITGGRLGRPSIERVAAKGEFVVEKVGEEPARGFFRGLEVSREIREPKLPRFVERFKIPSEKITGISETRPIAGKEVISTIQSDSEFRAFVQGIAQAEGRVPLAFKGTVFKIGRVEDTATGKIVETFTGAFKGAFKPTGKLREFPIGFRGRIEDVSQLKPPSPAEITPTKPAELPPQQAYFRGLLESIEGREAAKAIAAPPQPQLVPPRPRLTVSEVGGFLAQKAPSILAAAAPKITRPPLITPFQALVGTAAPAVAIQAKPLAKVTPRFQQRISPEFRLAPLTGLAAIPRVGVGQIITPIVGEAPAIAEITTPIVAPITAPVIAPIAAPSVFPFFPPPTFGFGFPSVPTGVGDFGRPRAFGLPRKKRRKPRIQPSLFGIELGLRLPRQRFPRTFVGTEVRPIIVERPNGGKRQNGKRRMIDLL